jgi:mycofactocin system glycosyltransferase
MIGSAAAPAALPPAELPVALDPSARVLGDGRLLVGGSPLRLLSLTDAGARTLAGWRTPSPVGSGSGRRRLARRMLDAGLLAPHPAPGASTSELTVVVPARDRPAAVERCLDAILAACPGSAVVLVDDGSAAPAPIRAACAARGVEFVRQPVSLGPAAARNRGLAVCRTRYVAFVDSDVVLDVGSARALLGHLSDPCVGAVAPRVCALRSEAGLIGGYETRHSALDMGRCGGLAAPGRATSYVPATVLVARRDALGEGFDESLRTGEDVDLVWRLCRAGWRVRYAPEIAVRHEHRSRLRDFVATRYRYARSAGALARRHPSALPATRLAPSPALIWGLTLAGRPGAALAATSWTTLRRARRLAGLPGPRHGLAALTVARGLGLTGLALAQATRRSWSVPLLALAPRHPRVRAVLLAAFAIPVLQDAIAAREPRALPGDAPLRLLEELVAVVGTWDGCLRERTLRPLLPSRHPAPA